MKTFKLLKYARQPEVKPYRPKYFLLFIAFLLFLLFAAVLSLPTTVNGYDLFPVFVLLYFGAVYYFRVKDRRRFDASVAEDLAGTLFFENGALIFEEKTEQQRTQIEYFELYYDAYYGEDAPGGRRDHMIEVPNGANNIIKIGKGDQQLKFRMVLKDEADKSEVLVLLKAAYKNGIKLKEFYKGQRTFLFKTPTYKEIQGIKEKYGVEW